MNDDVRSALAPSVSVDEFFGTWAAVLFENRHEDFKEFSDEDIILCFKFQDTGKVFSLELGHSGLVVEEDEMIDFPVLTLVGWEKFWPTVKKHGLPLVESMDQRRAEVREVFRITRAFLDDWEKWDVAIDVRIEGEGDAVEFQLVLNDYEPSASAKRFGFTLPLDDLRRVSEGDDTPAAVAKKLRISGDYKTAATLGGMLLHHQRR